MKMKNIFICGAFYNKDIYLNSKKSIDNAASNVSKKYISIFNSMKDNELFIINAPFVNSYPKYYSKIWYKGLGKFDNIIDISYLNIILIKHLNKYLNIRLQIHKIIKNIKNKDEICIIGYSMNSINLLIMKNYQKKGIKTCLIVPDLPEYMNLNNRVSWFKKILKNIDNVLIRKLLKYVNKIIVFSEDMKKTKYFKKKKCLLIEGVASENDIKLFYNCKTTDIKNKMIVYAGTLNYKYGIIDLIKAFSKLKDSEFELHICGTGEAKDEIIKIAKRNEKIIYHGNLKKDELFELYKKAYFLINPRSPEAEYTKYSFPSKIIEYISTGTPTLCYYLPGMPEEYRKYIFEIENNDKNQINNIYNALVKYLQINYSTMCQKAKEGQKYLLENKTEKILANQIMTFINE